MTPSAIAWHQGTGGAPGGGCDVLSAPGAGSPVAEYDGPAGRDPRRPHGPGRHPRRRRRSPRSSTSSPAASASARSRAHFPTRARVSEPALPLVLAALHEELGRGRSLPARRRRGRARRGRGGRLVPRTRAASRSFRAAASRSSSGLEPPPHLVGERCRALDVLAAGGLVCASARALAEGLPPRDARPAPIALARRRRAGPRRARRGARARRLRAGRAGRGARAVRRPRRARRRLPDRPAASRSAIELFGDEIEQVRAFSPFTQRALHPVDDAVVYPAAERRARPRRADLARATGDGRPRADDLVAAARPRARPRLAAGRGAAASWEEEGLAALGARRRRRARPASRGPSRTRSRRSARRSPRAASPRPRTSSRASSAAGNRVVVTFAAPRRGAAARSAAPQGRRAAARARRGAAGAEPALRFAVAPARRGLRLARARSRRCSRTRRSSASARRAPTRASAGRSRASPTCASATTSSTRTTASGSCSASRRRRSPASRATTSSSRSGRGPALRPARADRRRSRATSAPTRRAPALSKLGGKAWQNLKSRARASVRELAGELLAALRAAPAGAEGVAYDLSSDWLERLEASFPYRETRRPAAGDRGREGGPRGAAADGPARLRRRRLRQDRGRRAGGVRGRASTAGRRSCSARRRSSPSSTGTRSASATATSRSASRWSRASAGRPR